MLKILTLNLNLTSDKHGPWPERRALISSAIRDAAPDIILFQAVHKDPAQEGGLSQAEQLAALDPDDYGAVIFEPAITYPDGSQDGLAILSRVPAAAVDIHPLTLMPGLEDTNPRLLLHARFNLHSGPLHVFNGHFSWVPEQAEQNAREASAFMGLFNGKRMLAGDLNNPPDAPAFQQMRRSGWTDAWSLIHPGSDGFTFEAGAPSKRIDYIWLFNSLANTLDDIELIAPPRDSRVRYGDHLGLAATLDVDC